MVHWIASCDKEKEEEGSSHAVRQDTGLVVVSCDKVEGMAGVAVDEVRGSKEGQEYMVE